MTKLATPLHKQQILALPGKHKYRKYSIFNWIGLQRSRVIQRVMNTLKNRIILRCFLKQVTTFKLTKYRE